MSRIFDWIEEQASSILKVLYITYMVTAVATYFSEGARQADIFNVLFGSYSAWVLAFALSVHAYFTARNMKSNFVTVAALREAKASAAAQGAEGNAQEAKYAQQIAGQWMQFRVNLGFLVLLLGFDIWNQLQYLIGTWHPQETALSGPAWLQYIFRATIIPVLFLGVAFMTKSIPTLVEQIQHEANTFARDVFNAGRKQWKQGLKRMADQGQDVTALMVDLIEDPGARNFLKKVHPYIAPKAVQANSPVIPPAAPVPALPAPSTNGNGHSEAPTNFTALPADIAPVPAIEQMNNVAPASPPANPARPTPNSKAFPKWVYDQAYALMRERRDGEVVNLATLSERTGYEPRVVGEALRAYRPTVERRLAKGETMADNIVYANPGFLLLASTPIGR